MLFIIFAGFTSGDVQKTLVELEWYENQSVFGEKVYTFKSAFYKPEAPHLPLFCKVIETANGQADKHFWIDNAVFEEIKGDYRLPDSLPDTILYDQKTLVSDRSKKIHFTVVPIQKKGERIFVLKSFELKSKDISTHKNASILSVDWKQESELNEGKWVKIRTLSHGIHRLPFSTLESWGFNSPEDVGVFGSGNADLSENPGEMNYDDLVQNSVWVDQVNGEDHLFFFAQGGAKWEYYTDDDVFRHRVNPYSEQGFYFLTDKPGAVKPVQQAPLVEGEADIMITSFKEYLYYEKELVNLLPHGSGRQWFGESFRANTSRSLSFSLTKRVDNSQVDIQVNACGRSFQSSRLDVEMDGQSIGVISFSKVNTGSQTSLYADQDKKQFTANPGTDELELRLQYISSLDNNAMAWLDYVEINYQRKLSLDNEALYYRNTALLEQNRVVEYVLEGFGSNSRVMEWDESGELLEIKGEVAEQVLRYKGKTDKLREFVAFNPEMSFPVPEFAEEVQNQNLHGIKTPEFLIISHPAFLDNSERLANFHRSYDGMDVEVVNVEKVYNEFSSGTKNPTGIRNFIKMIYDRSEGLKYVMLFGDGSYDNRNLSGNGINFVPTYQSYNSLSPTSSFQSDDYFVMMDAGESVYDGAIDLGIGRIPSSTEFEAELVVEKIISYHDSSTLGDWKNQVCFIGDDEDNSLHMADSERLASKVNAAHKEFITDKIYFDAFQEEASPAGESYPGVTEAINQRVKDGVLVLNYVGHANNRFMADEHVLDVSDVNTWTNAENLPIFVTATCEFSRFDAEEKSIGEYVLFNPNGGGIALFSTTRVVFAYSNYLLSNSFYDFVFAQDNQGKRYRMGDIIRLAKTNTFNSINKRNFSLLGDPALRLAYPENRVVTTRINGQDASQASDTVAALEKISIEGHIADFAGDKIDGFNGEIKVTVFDKQVNRETLGNGGEKPMTFKVQENIIYQGVASVVNGDFSFSFVIPKDIVYSLGAGKIVYYANDNTSDAHGAYENFLIGGPSGNITDNTGPDIEAYLDSPEFRNGDVTSKSPMLYAKLFDENGINTVGSGIGHDITAVLDGDYSNVIVLNEFYQADLDDYKSGTIAFPLSDLSEGQHTLTIKAWDVANNSSEAIIEFEVSGDFNIEYIENYPNPVKDYTYFVFNHNQSGEILDVIVEIFDTDGRRIDLIRTEVGSDGKTINPIRWDLEESNILLRSGIYVYRVMAQNSDGKIATKSGKLICTR